MAARATGTKKAAEAKPDPVPDPDPDTPQILRFTTPPEPDEPPGPGERTPVFYIDGKVYDAPKQPPFGYSVEYMHRVRKQGGQLADDWLLEAMLGTANYTELREYALSGNLEPRHLAQVIAELGIRALGPREETDPKDSASG